VDPDSLPAARDLRHEKHRITPQIHRFPLGGSSFYSALENMTFELHHLFNDQAIDLKNAVVRRSVSMRKSENRSIPSSQIRDLILPAT
jgi:hypothetical protein